MTVINRLEIENVKRVKAVRLTPEANGLTVIGGRNNQGKTSVLDAIAWGLGGDKFRPGNAARDGSVLPPSIRLELDNGLIVERKGKNSALKVIDAKGNRGGQQLLNEFVSQLALDLPKFMAGGTKEKAETLLKIIGVGDELFRLEARETELYNKRHALGQIADRKRKFAEEQPFYPDAPAEPVSAAELIKEQQMILARNGRNEEFRRNAAELVRKKELLETAIEETRAKLRELEDSYAGMAEGCAAAAKTAAELKDESTAELEAAIAAAEETNAKVRANLAKSLAEDEANMLRDEYDGLTVEIERTREEKKALLDSADLPYPGLSVDHGELLFEGKKWDCLSGSDQLKIAAAIVRKLNPNCGFVLMDKLEQMDLDTLADFDRWLREEGLQVIATRVSTGGECEIIIEDGEALPAAAETKAPAKQWEGGTF